MVIERAAPDQSSQAKNSQVKRQIVHIERSFQGIELLSDVREGGAQKFPRSTEIDIRREVMKRRLVRTACYCAQYTRRDSRPACKAPCKSFRSRR